MKGKTSRSFCTRNQKGRKFSILRLKTNLSTTSIPFWSLHQASTGRDPPMDQRQLSSVASLSLLDTAHEAGPDNRSVPITAQRGLKKNWASDCWFFGLTDGGLGQKQTGQKSVDDCPSQAIVRKCHSPPLAAKVSLSTNKHRLFSKTINHQSFSNPFAKKSILGKMLPDVCSSLSESFSQWPKNAPVATECRSLMWHVDVFVIIRN